MSRTLRTLLSLAVAVALLGLLFAWGDVAPADLWATLGRLPLQVYCTALGVHAGIYMLRAQRFRVLIPPAVQPAYGRTLAASAAHNLAAYVLPAKTGEAALVLYLKRVCAVPGPQGTASLLVSRILDLAVLCAAMATACLFLGASSASSAAPAWMLPLGAGLALLSVLLLVLSARSHLLVRLALVLSRIVGLSRTRPGRRLQETVDRVAAALDEAGRGGRLARAIVLSLPIWLGVFLFYAILARGIGLTQELALPRATFGSGLAVLANLLPINGLAGFGTQETGWVIGFGALGVPRDLALSSGIGVHLIQLLNVCLFGLLGHLAMGWLPVAPDRGESSRDAEAMRTLAPMTRSNAQAQIELHRELAPRYAYRYSFAFSRLFQQDWHAEMISHVPAGARQVLDLGCGTGFFLAELEQRHPGSVGLDISHEMLRVSDQYVPGVKLITGDAEKLPFKPAAFDAVFCKGSLHHTRDHVGFLQNCRTVLQRDGVLIMSEPCNDNPLIRLARRVLYKKSQHFDEGDEGFTKKGIVSLCEQAGFEVTRVKKYGVLAYVFAGFPDHIGLLRWVPGSALLTRGFIALDRLLCALPGLSILGFHIVIVGKPR